MMITLILLGAFASALIGYLLLILPTQWLKVERVKYNLGLGLKILQLSDLHVERLRISTKNLQAVIEKEKPDYICITGDFTKLPGSLPRLKEYLAVIRDSQIPTYAVLGNHDHQQLKLRRLIQLIESFGIRILRNESLVLGSFQLIGIDDYDSGKSNIGKAFSRVDSSIPKIVITHDPNIVLVLTRKYDYLMAGHLHGKQFNIPYFYKIRPMGPLPAMGIYKGLNSTPYGTYYISKGMGQTGINIRFLVRSEVTMHYL